MWGRNQINLPEPVQGAFERKSRETRPGDETNMRPDKCDKLLNRPEFSSHRREE